MSEKLELKLQETYNDHKIAVGTVANNTDNLVIASNIYDGIEQRSRERLAQDESLFAQGKEAEKSGKSIPGAISDKMIDTRRKSEADLVKVSLQGLIDESDELLRSERKLTEVNEKASKFYNRPWNKGRIQDMAVKDATDAGYDITFGKKRSSEDSDNQPELVKK